MKLSCGKLDETYKQMFMLQRGLEGDESFMSHPVVWAELSEVLPASQQALIALVLEQKASSSTAAPLTSSATDALSSSALQSGTTTSTKQSQQPGCTVPVSIGPQQQASSDANKTLPCIVCDERPRNIRFHPCGHGVLCTECAALVRKCPFYGVVDVSRMCVRLHSTGPFPHCKLYAVGVLALGPVTMVSLTGATQGNCVCSSAPLFLIRCRPTCLLNLLPRTLDARRADKQSAMSGFTSASTHFTSASGGTSRHADGSRYEGLWRAGFWERGAHRHRNGVDVYDGDWVPNENATEHELDTGHVPRPVGPR
ncbi:hypothetical protein Pelo_18135 [Pelomyxa schiedti]|nr:hypothetical protein Pelo_18135 [Pelomyxa schiedti]